MSFNSPPLFPAFIPCYYSRFLFPVLLPQGPRKVQKFLGQPFHVAEVFTGNPGKYVKVEDTVRSFKEILDGKCDHIPEQCFVYKGAIEDVYAAYDEMMKKEEA